ncbi:molybdate ABC transporter, permease protein, partial [Vibrio harveyi]
MVDSFGNCF